jgi:hypothetical protein
MRLVALLSARAPAAGVVASAFAPDELHIGVHLPIEHQARQAILAGAQLLLLRTEFPTPELARAADALARETGISVLIAGDGPELARRIEKDDRIMMLGGQMIVPQPAMDELAAASPPTLLVTPTEPATAHFERIDGDHVWAGGALILGETVLSTVDMLGEWDLELTLLRRAVQQNAHRIELPSAMASSARLVRIDERADAERALAALTEGAAGGETSGDALSVALAPISRRLVASLARLHVNPGRLSWAGGMLAVLGVASASADWPRLALVIALIAEAALNLHDGCARIMLRRGAPLWLQVLIKGASLAVLGVIGGRLAQGSALALLGAGLPLALVAAQAVADARNRPALTDRSGLWTRLGTAMTLTIALAGALVGHASDAFVVIGLCAFGTVAARLLAPTDKRI